MEFQNWHLAVVAVFAALIVAGIRLSRQKTLIGLAAALLAVSGFLLYTLVLEEDYASQDLNGRLDDVALIGGPSLLAAGLILLAVRRRREAGVADPDVSSGR
ncbi:hypothetical protein ACTI_45990 [Actinoplanes sp. OR16]|uniref:hypothetical protein n=1 Tax=Actinoplanes sp. OR16 TaxID=946334 RepID=UPI000F6C9A4B|nr:hypothetical protein [Actinoplanes sp. OR16]BBH67914.1 hypothetical protein ACTI_45990 [Actinoplanes sp. OR16]